MGVKSLASEIISELKQANKTQKHIIAFQTAVLLFLTFVAIRRKE